MEDNHDIHGNNGFIPKIGRRSMRKVLPKTRLVRLKERRGLNQWQTATSSGVTYWYHKLG